MVVVVLFVVMVNCFFSDAVVSAAVGDAIVHIDIISRLWSFCGGCQN